MAALVAGLLLFLGLHSTRVFAEGARQSAIAKMGEGAWKGLYSVVSIAGFVLLCWGYGLARQQPVVLWGAPPVAMKHVAALLTLVAFVLVVAAYVPGNQIRARLHHPMLIGTKVWALAHLLANNTLADLLLFGGFLAWAVVTFRAARQRDRREGKVVGKGSLGMTLVAIVVGVVAWAGFAFWAHEAWIGVRPMG